MKFFKYIFIISLFLTACSSNKATKNNVAKKVSTSKIVKKHQESYLKKNTIDAKLKVKYKNAQENIGFSVQMKIEKDNVIYLKGTKFITVFKAKITPEKVQFYSPYYKNYFDGDFSMIKDFLGVDIGFKELQNILLGQAELSKQSKILFENPSYKISPKKQSDLFDVFFYVNPNHFKLDKLSLIDTQKNQRLDVEYPSYVEKENAFFPEKTTILVKENSKFTAIDMNTQSVYFNTKLNMPFKIPSNYKEIKL